MNLLSVSILFVISYICIAPLYPNVLLIMPFVQSHSQCPVPLCKDRTCTFHASPHATSTNPVVKREAQEHR